MVLEMESQSTRAEGVWAKTCAAKRKPINSVRFGPMGCLGPSMLLFRIIPLLPYELRVARTNPLILTPAFEGVKGGIVGCG